MRKIVASGRKRGASSAWKTGVRKFFRPVMRAIRLAGGHQAVCRKPAWQRWRALAGRAARGRIAVGGSGEGSAVRSRWPRTESPTLVWMLSAHQEAQARGRHDSDSAQEQLSIAEKPRAGFLERGIGPNGSPERSRGLRRTGGELRRSREPPGWPNRPRCGEDGCLCWTARHVPVAC